MSSAIRRGGIPGPESRTALTRPSMTEAEFECRIGTQAATVSMSPLSEPSDSSLPPELESTPRSSSSGSSRTRVTRIKPTKPRRVQRMFAIEEDLDKSSGSTPSTWVKTVPRLSMICCVRLLPRWCYTIPGTVGVAGLLSWRRAA